MKLHVKLLSGRLLFFLICFFFTSAAYADHLKGGWIKYSFVSATATKIIYDVSFYQYSDCSEPEKVDPYIFLSVYDAGTSQEIFQPRIVNITKESNEEKSDFGPCFQNPPTICYIVAEYTTQISVPVNNSGYVITSQRCCRIAGIKNVPASNNYGLTYTVTIPGGSNSTDNSPIFDFNDVNALCYNSPFSFDFSAKDPDGDSLVYSLCDGLTGGSNIDPNNYQPRNPLPPPYQTIPYISPYTGAQPLGASTSIDPKTGFFSGIAPSQTGTYVVAVCVDEFRKGVYIGHTRKEIHLDVENCKLGGAVLKPSYITCDGYNFSFADEVQSPDYKYYWDFGEINSTTDTSTAATPTYNYKDTGDYIVKLIVSNSAGCIDSTTTHVKIFPGFVSDFSVAGSCSKNPYSFTDLTKTKYGYVNSWQWFFSDTLVDTLQNFDYLFADTGYRAVTLISTNSKGCVDTITKPLRVTLGPDVQTKFADTLICSIDTLQLQSSSSLGGAKFSWTPLYNINDPTSRTPLVSPKQTTTYNVVVSYQGCSSLDSVTVNVIDKVNASLPPDTLICANDSITLRPSTNALYFLWSPANNLDNSAIENPVATPATTTTYNLLASVGKCSASTAQTISVAPYPKVNAGNDVSICYGRTVQLNAATDGQTYNWSPVNSLLDSNSLDPIAGPETTTEYILTVSNSVGCPKPVSDTVTVNVIPKVQAFAGNDTTAVANEPIQLNATGGDYYEWSPATYLSNTLIQNPVAILPGGLDTIVYTVRVSTEAGCSSSDSIKIYLFETHPAIFIPTAFTPNGDGRNDIMRPTVAGMRKFLYFNVYNRWGQLLYSTSQEGRGWDGTFAGEKQPSGTYVYTAAAIDYTGKNYFAKGSFVLIR